MEVGID